MTLPKLLTKYEKRIADYSDERENGDGIWVYYKRGWKSFTDPLGTQHQDHQDTVREIAFCARNVEPCDCADCRPH